MIFKDQAYKDIKEIYIKFQEDSGSSDMEIKTLLRALARAWEKENQIKSLLLAAIYKFD